MNYKKAMAMMMIAGLAATAQPVWAEEAQTEDISVTAEAAAEEEVIEDAGETADTEAAADAAAQSQKLDTYYTLALNAINTEDYETANKYLDICFAYCDPQTDPVLYADLMLKRACIDVIDGDTDMALNELDAALKTEPELADAYLVRTQIYTALGDFSTAVENLEKYIELTEDTSLYETVAQLHEANGDLDQAAAAYNKYVEGSGEEIQEAGFQNGLYLMEGGRYEEAIEAFEAYAEDETYGAGAMYNIGVCSMNSGDYAKAAEAFTACEEKGGEFEGLYYNRGVCALLNGDWETAAADFETSIETEPYASEALYNLGICKMQQEDYEGAVATFTELIGDGQETKASEEVEEAAEDTAEEETAEEPVEEMTEETAEATEETMAEETDETAANENTGAETEGETTTEYPVNYGAYYYRAMCEGALGNLEAALADYTVCIDNGYDLSQSYYQRAQVYAALGDTENQTADLENSLKTTE